MDWVKKFYSQTGKWWGPAESKIINFGKLTIVNII